MADITLIEKYFPIDDDQREKFQRLNELFSMWNVRINMVSRKDVSHLYERHILHSLAIAKFISFLPGAKVLDVGTGGGFPGLPLAIMFPQTKFHLIDSIGKKIKVVENIADELNLTNVTTEQVRAENHHKKYNFIVTRAVASLDKLVRWTKDNIIPGNRHQFPNGLIALKGGNLSGETAVFPQAEIIPVNKFFEEPFFETKKIVFLPYTGF